MKQTFVVAFFVCATGLLACGVGDHRPVVQDPDHTGVDGDTCTDDRACDGDTCLVSIFGYPDGYCTTSGCRATSDCHGERSVCLEFVDGSSSCFRACSSVDDCREGYGCIERGGQPVCLPQAVDLPDATFAPPITFDESMETLGAQCTPEALGSGSESPTWRFEFNLGESASSFVVTPYVTTGTVRPLTMTTPNEVVDFETYRHHNTRIEDLINPPRGDFGTYGAVAFDWPVLVPFAPEYESYVVPGGEYRVDVQTDGAQPCLYVVEGNAGSTLDLDIHIVGVDGLSAESAAVDSNVAEALEAAEGHLSTAGITFGDVRFLEAEPEVSERFAIVRDLSDIDLLTATGAPRGPSFADHMKIDVFIVDAIIFNGFTALGISASLPGSPGMHGNGANGLVFGAADLGNNNDVVGQIMAHELAHYLGLRHTTELIHGAGNEAELEFEAVVGVTDPIEDTEYCDNVTAQGRSCPDYHNLMFPTLQNPNDEIVPVLSEGQRYVLRRSPLVRPQPEE